MLYPLFVVASVCFVRESKWILDRVTKALNSTSHANCPPSITWGVSKVFRVENKVLWQTYRGKCQHLLSKHQLMKTTINRYGRYPRREIIPEAELDHNMNEAYLFHGTKPEYVAAIAETGFDERIANPHGLYGAGIYFANQACKSIWYSRLDTYPKGVLIMARVVLGCCYIAESGESYKELRRAPFIPESTDSYDCLIAEPGVGNQGRQVHYEFVIYDKAQTYPEYVIELERNK